MRLIRTLLVDDSSEFLEAAQRFLATETKVEIIGQAHSGQDAVKAATRLEPDLILMDLSMPGMNGLDATRQIKALPDPPKVIILTIYDNPEYRTAAQAVQADGFVTKSEFGSELLPLIQEIYSEALIAEPEQG
jgi:DNA-binding NarL/FixJ family response regulator